MSKSIKIDVKAVIVLLLIFVSCRKIGNDTGIPLVAVDVYIYTSDPAFFNLNPIGGWEYVSGGSRGLLIYRKSDGEFMVYDRHCTYNPSDNCGKVFVDSSNVIAVDTCCGSEFLITDGSVLEGPASYALKQYQASFDGSVLHIYN